MNSKPALHVVLGAGQIGPRVAERLLAQGHRVRIVRKSAAGTPRPGLEWRHGDIRDLAFAEEATRGADVVYDCMNPPYHKWPELLLPIARGALHGAAKANARLVALDSLYMYGRPTGPMREDTPMNPCSKKGALRAELSDLRTDAHARGDVRVAIGRASDFFGADLPLSSFSSRFFDRIQAGRPAECIGDPDMPHAYTYVEDVARGLVTLGTHEAALGRVWHLPTPPAESTRALVARVGAALGIEAETARVPMFVIRALGLFIPFMRELPEMAYQWEVPFEVDDRRFVEAFGWSATPIEEAVEATAAWARRRRAA